jgi:hypothetical protein
MSEVIAYQLLPQVAGLQSRVSDLESGGTTPTLDAVPAPVASVDFVQQQALQFRIENRTSDPGSPAVGEIWLRVDL